MKISAINEGVSLIANIGVIGSIVFRFRDATKYSDDAVTNEKFNR